MLRPEPPGLTLKEDTMNFDDPEVVELGPSDELIQDDFSLDTTESAIPPTRVRVPSATYVADAE